MQRLPAAVRATCWLNAWLAGRESADAVISGLADGDAAAEFVGPGAGSRQSCALFLGELRRQGVRRASSALPLPGDPLGLGGPPAFNADALDAGEAVVLHGADLGLVPAARGAVTSWQVGPARSPGHLPAVAEADRALRAALKEAADALADLDVASWRPEVADALTTLRRPVGLEEAPFPTPDCARLAATALRASSIVALARVDDGGALSSWDADLRSAALRPLERAARSGLVAASSSYDGS